MALVTLLRHFADYDNFRRVYDSADGLRQAGGCYRSFSAPHG